MTIVRFLLLSLLVISIAPDQAVVVGRWPATEARQGVAVDAQAFYAIDGTAIGKYDKTTGRKLAAWQAAPGEPFIHLDSGVVIGSELVCAHSNYPAVPMHSTIEVFDTATLKHLRTQDLGIGRGSATWVDFHDGAWWVAFAHYSARGGEPGKGSDQTTLRRFDTAWREQAVWTYPAELVAKWGGMSNSGGAWGTDNRLYTTGHDNPELYVLEAPAGGGVLRVVSTIAIESNGQGIALDRATGTLYSIQRATKEVIASRLPSGTEGRGFSLGHQAPVEPVLISEPAPHDSEDVAFWIDLGDPSKSLILATDKHETDGALLVYDVNGRLLSGKVVSGLRRPNNVDVEYGLAFQGKTIDIAVTTERAANRLRVHRVPDMTPIDGGGIEVFTGVDQRLPMGIAIYKRPRDGAIFAIISRSQGPSGSYLWEYRLQESNGRVIGTKVREFGTYSGKKTMESLAVDDELGYLYASDEQVGVRKYAADPDAADANRELALFATSGFKEDHEGISIYPTGPTAGYIIVSDQSASRFHLFRREGDDRAHPHTHTDLGTIPVKAFDSDGSDVTPVSFGPRFPKGALVAMSGDKTFHYYSWSDLIQRLPER